MGFIVISGPFGLSIVGGARCNIFIAIGALDCVLLLMVLLSWGLLLLVAPLVWVLLAVRDKITSGAKAFGAVL
jgi:hypothetical protein